MGIKTCIYLVLLGAAFASHDDIEIEDGGYTNLLVTVQRNVTYDPNILTELENKFKEASRALYDATLYDYGLSSGKSIRYFRDVTVFVPKEWRNEPEIKDKCTSAGGVNKNRAHFIVGPPTDQWDELPHTDQQHNECGVRQNKPIYLPAPFVIATNPNNIGSGQDKLRLGDFGKAIVHEWAIYRYGLFEESTAKDGTDFKNCEIVPIDGGKDEYIAIKCSSSMGGRTNGNKNGCKYTPSRTDDGARGSLMFYGPEFMDRIETFCDALAEGRGVDHEYDVNHNHNRVCSGLTGWEILRENPDFTDHEGPDFDDGIGDLSFKCVVEDDVTRYVIVMDVSGSMSGQRLADMRTGVALFLENIWEKVTDGSNVQIGMVQFESKATILLDMMNVETEQDIQEIQDKIPTVASGGTCIGCGILDALTVLAKDGGQTENAKIYVFTDGEETTAPFIREVADNVTEAQSIIYGMLMIQTSSDHDLIKLADQTGGDSCIYKGDDEFYDCLADLDDEEFLAMIQSQSYDVSPSDSTDGSVDIDSSHKNKVRFTLSWASSFGSTLINEIEIFKHYPFKSDEIIERLHKALPDAFTFCNDLTLQITSPSGAIIGPGDPGYEKDDDFRYISITAENNQAGNWKYTITNPGNSTCKTRVRTEGFEHMVGGRDDMQKQLTVDVLVYPTRLNITAGASPLSNTVKLFVTVHKGNAPVVDAEVTAHIENNLGFSSTLDLLDNGSGADLYKDDGIYSRYFHNFTHDSVYNVRVDVRGVQGKVNILMEKRSMVEMDGEVAIEKTSHKNPYESFERTSIGGFFEVSGAVGSDTDTLFPPAKVTDLHVVGAVSNTSVQVAWTAVGHNLDEGTALRYDFRVSRSTKELRDEFSNAIEVTDSDLHQGSLLSPEPSGSYETIAINPQAFDDTLNGTFFIALQAVNSKGTHGQTSNMAIVHFTIEEQAAPPAPTPTQKPGDPGAPVYLVAILSVCIIASIIAVAVGAAMYKKNRDNKVTPVV